MMRHLSLILLCLISHIIYASNLQIQPVNVYFKPKQNITSIKFTNHDKTPIILQLSIMRWQQNLKGKDVYQKTQNILVTPKIFTVKSGHEQIIRLAIMKPINRNTEQTYRLFIKEIPQKDIDNKNSHLQLVMQYILPVFINAIKPETNVTYHLLNHNKEKQDITVMNQSNHHIVLTGILINDKNNNAIGIIKERGIYILAGQQKQLTVPLTNKNTIPNSAKIIYIE